mmetsp:Transcript_2049/g.5017  ORF Transcript_2049/g.5017 Transcript_2049/m.5017 type:complete len:364 (-) Transcript_2049:2051-3142(-)
MLKGLPGENLQGAQELELEVDVLQVDTRALRRAQVPQVALQAVWEEDSITIDFNGPIVLQVPTIVTDLVPCADEGVDVVDGGRVAPAETRALEEGVIVTLIDAAPCRLDIVGQLSLRAPEGLLGGVIPHYHCEAEQRGALDQDALWGLRDLARAHASELGAVPIAGSWAQVATREVLVPLVARVPLELREPPIWDRDIRAALGVDAILTCPGALPDGRHPRLCLEDLFQHRNQAVLLGQRAAEGRVELVVKQNRSFSGLREEVAGTLLNRVDGLLALLVLVASLPARLYRVCVHGRQKRRHGQRLCVGQTGAWEIKANSLACNRGERMLLSVNRRLSVRLRLGLISFGLCQFAFSHLKLRHPL